MMNIKKSFFNKAYWPIAYLCCFLLFFGLNCDQKGDLPVKTTVAPTALKASENDGQNNDTLIREFLAEPKNLNPVLTDDSSFLHVRRLIFDPLIDIDGGPESKLIGRLAEKWSVSDDKLKITFFLRPDITWHDGAPFTAEDVKFTFETTKDKNIPSPALASIIDTIAHIEVTAPLTVTFTFKYPFSPGLVRVGNVFIIPKHRLDTNGLKREGEENREKKIVTFLTSDFNRKPIGTGSYIVQEWRSAEYIKLVANKDYWDKQNLPDIKNVIIKIIPNRTAAFNMLQKGELDMFRARSLQYMHFRRLKNLHEKFKVVKFYRPEYYYIAWNLRPEAKFFTDIRVRKAMTHALDRNLFVESSKFGLGKVITGPFYFESWAYNHKVEPFSYDFDKAAELLQDAGWVDSDQDGVLAYKKLPFKFELLISSGAPTWVELASIIQSNLKKLSIDVVVKIVDYSQYLTRIQKGEFDAYVGGWPVGIDPDPYAIWHSSQVGIGHNNVGYNNKTVDKLLEAGRQEFDQKKRQKIYWKIHQLIHDDQPYTFIYCPMDKYIYSSRIKNIHISPFGIIEFFPGQLSWTLQGQ
ncbi:peptide-binding protein [candidate division CSSED10-310 bacterium]|uniref:Peptide-binding protein n=1 Tax=candidate division CSSED10-310 bacterium TaxID=2855610 RepID=A0ABV6Z4N9_UNCC1